MNSPTVRRYQIWPPTTYIYVDGESHYRRLEGLWKETHPGSSLADAIPQEAKRPEELELESYFPHDLPFLYHHQPAAFFWDRRFVWPNGSRIKRAIYFTSCAGDDGALHEARLKIRAAGFEPEVARETTQLANRRANNRSQQGLMEKAKGVDIGLAVRMLEDAYLGNFDACYLFTSDIDFLPVIKAVRRMGKRVDLFGFRSGLSQPSELEYVPDTFTDLTNTRQLYLVKNSTPGLRTEDSP